MKRKEAAWVKIGNWYYQEKFAVFDIETIGFSADGSQMIEIGAVRMENGNIVDRFSALINPGAAIPVKTEQVTGITNSMFGKEVKIDAILPKFIAFCEDSTLVTHNAAFAVRFIKESCKEQRIDWQFDILDTYALAHMILKKQMQYTLETVADTLGVSLAGRTGASETAKAIAQILYRLIERTKETDREQAVEARERKARETAMTGILDDMRRDAIAKIRNLSEQELKNGWQRISEAAIKIMVSNGLTRKEGILILEDTQIKSEKDAFFKELLRLFADGTEPELFVEIASNEYWLDEPAGMDAMIKYMQIKGVILMLSSRSNFELNQFLVSLIPKKLRAIYEREISAWETEVDEKVKRGLEKFREENFV